MTEAEVKDTVSKQGEDDEVDGGPHAGLHSSLRANAVVHHLIPVLSSEDLLTNTDTVTKTTDI